MKIAYLSRSLSYQTFALGLLFNVLCTNAQGQIAISYNVTPIAQPSEMSCWATAATMILNWKLGIQFKIKEVVARAGDKFIAIYDANKGISPTDEDAFYRALGLTVIKGNNPAIDAWGNILKARGPLSVTVDAKPGKGWIHALVVTGLNGDGSAAKTTVTYIDPSGGKKINLVFSEFLKLYEGSAKWPLQIIHNP